MPKYRKKRLPCAFALLLQTSSHSHSYSMACLLLLLLLPFLFQFNFIIPIISASNVIHNPNQRFIDCNKLYTCGSLKGIGYPFWGGKRPSFCGRKGFQLHCSKDSNYTKIKTFDDVNNTLVFRVLDIVKGINKMRLSRDDIWENKCPISYTNVTPAQIDNVSKHAIYVSMSTDVSEISLYYGCKPWVAEKHTRRSFTCHGEGGIRSQAFYAVDIASSHLGVAGCEVGINVPIERSSLLRLWRSKITLSEALKKGVEVLYYREMTLCSLCVASGGRCGSVDDMDLFQCHCPNGSSDLSCVGKEKSRTKQRIIAGSTVAGMAMLLVGIVIFYVKRNDWLSESNKIWRSDNRDLENLLKDYKSFAPRRFVYSEIKKMTDSFKDELGRGGYGTVYKGILPNDSCQMVAVKILKTSKGSGEDFINEVKSIGKTSHVNIVKLLGFCLEGRKKALVYEFMANGSLDKFIDGSNGNGLLGWEKLYQIAIGIARGLEYLHRGCSTRILHFDIKPHNILLDEDFFPKISDFGLAKQCNKKESFISMVDARGTIGYIAPELVSRMIGGVSHKSDVYSYGMMVLEIVGGLKKYGSLVEAAEDSSEMYFPHCVYKSLEQDQLRLKDQVMTEEEEFMVRKMMTVGLWCIQTDPSQRPSMGKVLQMLEGPIEVLETPPKPIRKISLPKYSANSSSESVTLSESGIKETQIVV